MFTLSVSVLLSFLSLAKTGYNVNKPDPDPDRKAAQTKANARLVHTWTVSRNLDIFWKFISTRGNSLTDLRLNIYYMVIFSKYTSVTWVPLVQTINRYYVVIFQ